MNMEKLMLEVGMKLDNNLIYYHDILVKNGLKLDKLRTLYYKKINNLQICV